MLAEDVGLSALAQKGQVFPDPLIGATFAEELPGKFDRNDGRRRRKEEEDGVERDRRRRHDDERSQRRRLHRELSRHVEALTRNPGSKKR